MAKTQLFINSGDVPFVINAIVSHANSLAAAIAHQATPSMAEPEQPKAVSKNGKRLGRPPKKGAKA